MGVLNRKVRGSDNHCCRPPSRPGEAARKLSGSYQPDQSKPPPRIFLNVLGPPTNIQSNIFELSSTANFANNRRTAFKSIT